MADLELVDNVDNLEEQMEKIEISKKFLNLKLPNFDGDFEKRKINLVFTDHEKRLLQNLYSNDSLNKNSLHYLIDKFINDFNKCEDYAVKTLTKPENLQKNSPKNFKSPKNFENKSSKDVYKSPLISDVSSEDAKLDTFMKEYMGKNQKKMQDKLKRSDLKSTYKDKSVFQNTKRSKNTNNSEESISKNRINTEQKKKMEFEGLLLKLLKDNNYKGKQKKFNYKGLKTIESISKNIETQHLGPISPKKLPKIEENKPKNKTDRFLQTLSKIGSQLAKKETNNEKSSRFDKTTHNTTFMTKTRFGQTTHNISNMTETRFGKTNNINGMTKTDIGFKERITKNYQRQENFNKFDNKNKFSGTDIIEEHLNQSSFKSFNEPNTDQKNRQNQTLNVNNINSFQESTKNSTKIKYQKLYKNDEILSKMYSKSPKAIKEKNSSKNFNDNSSQKSSKISSESNKNNSILENCLKTKCINSNVPWSDYKDYDHVLSSDEHLRKYMKHSKSVDHLQGNIYEYESPHKKSFAIWKPLKINNKFSEKHLENSNGKLKKHLQSVTNILFDEKRDDVQKHCNNLKIDGFNAHLPSCQKKYKSQENEITLLMTILKKNLKRNYIGQKNYFNSMKNKENVKVDDLLGKIKKMKNYLFHNIMKDLPICSNSEVIKYMNLLYNILNKKRPFSLGYQTNIEFGLNSMGYNYSLKKPMIKTFCNKFSSPSTNPKQFLNTNKDFGFNRRLSIQNDSRKNSEPLIPKNTEKKEIPKLNLYNNKHFYNRFPGYGDPLKYEFLFPPQNSSRTTESINKLKKTASKNLDYIANKEQDKDLGDIEEINDKKMTIDLVKSILRNENSFTLPTLTEIIKNNKIKIV